MFQQPSVAPPLGHMPFIAGPLGFRGVDTQQRILPGDIQVFYVDPGHANAEDNNLGVDPHYPLATLQELIDRSTGVSVIATALGDYDVVYVSGSLAESVVIGTTAQMPSFVRIIGVGSTPFRPTWVSGDVAQPCITMRAIGWTVEGFEFEVPTGAAAIKLDEVPASFYQAYKTVIRNCVFDGLWGGLYGIEFSGAPHRVEIISNWFLEIKQGGGDGFAIYITDSTHTNPYECAIVGNRFTECQNHIGNLGGIRGFNVSLFQDNIHEAGVLIPTTTYLDLRGGSRGENIVYRNLFMGDYSNTGGYYAHAANPGSWVGNIAQDVAEAEVSDSGLTIAPPAA